MQNKHSFLLEATPDFPVQIKLLKESTSFSEKETPDAIFLTHAHIGHYAGLMYLVESMERFKELKETEKQKIYFIHFNHSYPVLIKNSTERKTIESNGFNIAEIHERFVL